MIHESLSIQNSELDAIDLALLRRLHDDGRATWSDLAAELGLTAPAIAQRVRRLEERGVIARFSAVVNPSSIAPFLAFLSVRVDKPQQAARTRERLGALDEVLEIHHVGGADDHLLKTRSASLGRLERLVGQDVPEAGGVVTFIRIVLSTHKETHALPLPGAPAQKAKP